MKYLIGFIFLLFEINIGIAQNKSTINFKLLNFTNKTVNDFCPTIYKNGLIFVTDRNKENQFFELYYSNFKSNPKKIKISNSEMNVGQIFCDEINNSIYLTKSSNIAAKNGMYNLAIYKGKIKKGKIIKLSKLKFCSPEFSYGHVSLSNNNKTMLFLKSEKSGYSIYEYKLERGKWKKNAIIISEKFPMMNPFYKDKNTLIFSSKRKGGVGGYDLYKIVKQLNKWSKPINLTKFNTEFDELSLLYINDKEGYISSSRIDNKDHIFKFITD